MSYRDDEAALRSYHDDLVRQVAALAGAIADRDALSAEHQARVAELAKARIALDAHAARRAPVRLEGLRVASPCKERWDGMVGDDQARFCKRCSKHVYNLSAMTAAEADELLGRTGEAPCVRFFRRADGTVMTSDCGAPRKRIAVVAAGALTAAAVAGALVFTRASSAPAPEPEAPSPSEVMGGVDAPPPVAPDVVAPDVAVPTEIEVLGEPMQGAAMPPPPRMVEEMGKR